MKKRIIGSLLTLAAIIMPLGIGNAQAAEDTFVSESEPNNDYDHANIINISDYVVGNFDYAKEVNSYDLDYFKVTVPKDGYLYVGFMASSKNSPKDITFGLYDKNQIGIQPFTNEIDGQFSSKAYAVTAGEYYISSNSKVEKNVSYTLYTEMLDMTPPEITVNKITSKSKSVTGKTEVNASIKVKLGSKVLGKSTADNKGNFKVKIKAQKKGTKLTIVASDKAENIKTVTVTVK